MATVRTTEYSITIRNRKLYRNQRAIKIKTKTLCVLIPWDKNSWLCIIKISLIYKKHSNSLSYLYKPATTNLQLNADMKVAITEITLEPSFSSETEGFSMVAGVGEGTGRGRSQVSLWKARHFFSLYGCLWKAITSESLDHDRSKLFFSLGYDNCRDLCANADRVFSKKSTKI